MKLTYKDEGQLRVAQRKTLILSRAQRESKDAQGVIQGRSHGL